MINRQCHWYVMILCTKFWVRTWKNSLILTFSISILYCLLVNSDSSFISVKLGLESCSKGDRCPDAMVCQSGVCACEMGTMTDDRKFCLKSDEKLLGSYCTPSADECFQLSGTYCMPSSESAVMYSH